MKNLIQFLSQLLKGGIFFLFPIILVIILFQKAISLLKPLAAILSEKGGWHSSITSNAYFLSILILFVICLIAGFIANQGVGKKIILWIENNFLTLFPGYQLMKNTMQNTAGLDSETNFPVVLVPIDGWMIGFQVDELESGEYVVFVPSAPNIWEGNVVIFKKEEIKKTNLAQKDVNKLLRQLGVNSHEILNKKTSILN
ncbi:DUF502 domain-containing protein [Algoriphagus sp.]|uniref:DUF502 domain-containing protein n=1 Tax=Algoriphagus sp. TaxID=1872435 RepID=UPI0025DCB0C3|nr:DUF502 domain-containing protein [Algoriphagus sp.]